MVDMSHHICMYKNVDKSMKASIYLFSTFDPHLELCSAGPYSTQEYN